MNRRIFLSTTAAFGMGLGWTPALAQEATEEPLITEMVLGDPDAPVEVIEYASYTCPHCANFHASLYPQLKADYIDTGKVRFIYREVYFDRFGLWASMLARCSGDTRFFGISSVLYEKQREWTAGGDPVQISANLRQIGKIAGLEDEALDACMSDGTKAQSLVDWFTENTERDDINSTPTFLINGLKLEGSWLSGLLPAIDAAL